MIILCVSECPFDESGFHMNQIPVQDRPPHQSQVVTSNEQDLLNLHPVSHLCGEVLSNQNTVTLSDQILLVVQVYDCKQSFPGQLCPDFLVHFVEEVGHIFTIILILVTDDFTLLRMIDSSTFS